MSDTDDTRPLSRDERIDEFGREFVEHSEWAEHERERLTDVFDAITDTLDDRADVALKRHGRSVSNDGEHELRLRLLVDGDPWVRDDATLETIYRCGICERLYNEPRELETNPP
jgi:hypothetical protein